MSEPSAIALHVSQRLFAREGETRINLLRVLAVALFFCVHLVNRYVIGMSPGATLVIPLGADSMTIFVFDTVVIAVSLAWAGVAGAVLIIVRSSFLQKLVGPTTTLLDVAFLSILLLIGNGPTSPMIGVLLLIIAASGLRGQRELVWLSTICCLVSYASTLGMATVVRPELMAPTYHILIVTSSLMMAGVITDLTVGSFWRLAESHGATVLRATQSAGATAVPTDGRCPWCLEPTGKETQRCASCEQPLAEGVPARTRASTLRTLPAYAGWAASVVAMVVLTVALGIGLAIQWPALLVPYVGAALLLLVALVRMLQLDLRVDEEDKAVGRTMSTLGTAAATLALGATAVTMLLGVLLMLTVGAGVVAFALCCAVLAGMGGV